MKAIDSVNIGGALVVVLVMMFVMLQKSDKNEINLEAQYIPIEQLDMEKSNNYYDGIRP